MTRSKRTTTEKPRERVIPGRVAPREPKVLLFDIEATGLNATFGVVLCIGWKWLGETAVHCPTLLDRRRKDMLDDKALIAEFAYGPYADADYTVGWYSGHRRYDLPMLKARAIKHGLRPFAPVQNIDLWAEWKKQFKTHNSRLATVSEFLKTTTRKTPIDFEAWQYASMGDRKAMQEVVRHCKADVLSLEETYNKMRPWLDVEPGRELFTGKPDQCPSCGSDRLWSDGYKFTLAGAYQRLRCQDCGKYVRVAGALAHTAKRNTI